MVHSEHRFTACLAFFHGNAGNISHRGESVAIFHRLGLNIFVIGYRGYGQSGGKPSEKGFYEDARAAWQYLTETKDYHKQDIIIFGRSLGGVVATHLAAEVASVAQIMDSTLGSPVFALLVGGAVLCHQVGVKVSENKLKSPDIKRGQYREMALLYDA